MRPNILRFWFWRARLMLAGLPDNLDKVTKLQVTDDLTIELHPASAVDHRPMLKLCRHSEEEQQSINIYLKEVPLLMDILPNAIAQLVVLGVQQGNQQNYIHQLERIKNIS